MYKCNHISLPCDSMILSTLNFYFFIYFIVTLKKKIILEENSKKEMFICEISIIIILICQKFTPGLRHKGLANLGP